MFQDPRGPIERFAWGTFTIAGHKGPELGKDIRLIGTEASPWRERKGHKLQPAMITGVYGRDIEVLVIGAGVYGSLRCPKKVRAAIREQGIPELVVERTPEACRIYNDLFHQGKRVAMLAHGTC